MAVRPIPTRHLVALMGGAGVPDHKEEMMHGLAHPIANIAFEVAGLIGLWAIIHTFGERRRG